MNSARHCTKINPLHLVNRKILGFSLVEVLVATALIAIILIPALSSLQSGIQGSNIHTSSAYNHYRIKGKMEEVLAKSFNELQQEADHTGNPTVIVDSYSDSSGIEDRRLVYLSRFDADNADADDNPFTDTDVGIIWIKVQIENTNYSLESLAIE